MYNFFCHKITISGHCGGFAGPTIAKLHQQHFHHFTELALIIYLNEIFYFTVSVLMSLVLSLVLRNFIVVKKKILAVHNSLLLHQKHPL